MNLGQDEHETDAKNQTLTNSTSELTNPLEMVKKTYQAFESINYVVRDAKNRTLTNSASKLTNPLKMVKKHFMLLNRSVLKSELVFGPR